MAAIIGTLFGCHSLFFYHIHNGPYSESTIPLTRLLADPLDQHPEEHEPAPGVYVAVDSSIFRRVKDSRDAWLRHNRAVEKELDFSSRRLKANIVMTVLLLASSGMILLSTVYLVGDMPSPGSASWMNSTRVQYVLLPVCMAPATLVARFLQAKSNHAVFGSAEVIWGAAATNHRLLFIAFPALIFSEWVVSSVVTAAVLDWFQFATVSAALLVSVYRVQTGRDDW